MRYASIKPRNVDRLKIFGLIQAFISTARNTFATTFHDSPSVSNADDPVLMFGLAIAMIDANSIKGWKRFAKARSGQGVKEQNLRLLSAEKSSEARNRGEYLAGELHE